MVKLTDVAKLAGVSPTTVSRVINNYGYLSEKTIRKVHEAMETLNYQPNNLARSLQGKKTNLIGLIFPSVSDPFFGELIETIERKLFERGYKTILCNAEHDSEKERAYLKMLAANQVDGIIAGSHNLGIVEYENIDLPIISFDRALSPNITIVSSDNFSGGKIATNHLIMNGCQQIGMISGSLSSSSPTNLRNQGYLEVIKDKGLTPHTLLLPRDTTHNLKINKIKKFILDEHLEAIFASDDLTADLVLKVAHSLNKPNFKVVGYDGTKLAQRIFPNLTTIIQPIDEIAEVLIDCLITRIKQPDEFLDQNIILPVQLLQGKE
ncbi:MULTISPECIES: LacI family DNA-binding transcriptional regulator [unclassified Enterococcus]|uniref:LacI family DNA-binding transcriptional regulator n=1 Tax=unclassified Enterococcus TaxID=2608891 RepID=UPI001557EA48|nr:MULTISPECIES: LacI family DNA-binding transcriptional regulator [unclassified Enterococcus]MBS7576302.1 LacI family DNA-binding transcriptional regulator [Enterococcus sp. MMGLQ5-2]MBS7583535.1 LacI family DNA-binding transcriptional regulator [Enterococcus sp. MMGLQ5-1]NPD11397.1 LacI family DNA-binding transcriptional regulator [Enterococcus sp. MMGLQ5-1]NPD36140.1 LacI family DNA-binding transcriptional regulator [Enterococcus sp. MMGLQ5-2]